MQNIHSELAIQQRVDFSIGSGNQSGQDFLEREADSTMNHEIVPKSINRLRLAQNMSAGRISNKNMHNMTNMQNMHLGCVSGASKVRVFTPSSKSGSAPSTRRIWPIVQWSMRS